MTIINYCHNRFLQAGALASLATAVLTVPAATWLLLRGDPAAWGVCGVMAASTATWLSLRTVLSLRPLAQ